MKEWRKGSQAGFVHRVPLRGDPESDDNSDNSDDNLDLRYSSTEQLLNESLCPFVCLSDCN